VTPSFFLFCESFFRFCRLFFYFAIPHYSDSAIFIFLVIIDILLTISIILSDIINISLSHL
jgi:hypothetical protein